MTLIIPLIIIALIFDFLNGFHDSSNIAAAWLLTIPATALGAAGLYLPMLTAMK